LCVFYTPFDSLLDLDLWPRDRHSKRLVSRARIRIGVAVRLDCTSEYLRISWGLIADLSVRCSLRFDTVTRVAGRRSNRSLIQSICTRQFPPISVRFESVEAVALATRYFSLFSTAAVRCSLDRACALDQFGLSCLTATLPSPVFVTRFRLITGTFHLESIEHCATIDTIICEPILTITFCFVHRTRFGCYVKCEATESEKDVSANRVQH
jgi:hypothetical protein